jgi:hypothetical protein
VADLHIGALKSLVAQPFLAVRFSLFPTFLCAVIPSLPAEGRRSGPTSFSSAFAKRTRRLAKSRNLLWLFIPAPNLFFFAAAHPSLAET